MDMWKSFKYFVNLLGEPNAKLQVFRIKNGEWLSDGPHSKNANRIYDNFFFRPKKTREKLYFCPQNGI